MPIRRAASTLGLYIILLHRTFCAGRSGGKFLVFFGLKNTCRRAYSVHYLPYRWDLSRPKLSLKNDNKSTKFGSCGWSEKSEQGELRRTVSALSSDWIPPPHGARRCSVTQSCQSCWSTSRLGRGTWPGFSSWLRAPPPTGSYLAAFSPKPLPLLSSSTYLY